VILANRGSGIRAAVSLNEPKRARFGSEVFSAERAQLSSSDCAPARSRRRLARPTWKSERKVCGARIEAHIGSYEAMRNWESGQPRAASLSHFAEIAAGCSKAMASFAAVASMALRATPCSR
jgi:hypothetical protein